MTTLVIYYQFWVFDLLSQNIFNLFKFPQIDYARLFRSEEKRKYNKKGAFN